MKRRVMLLLAVAVGVALVCGCATTGSQGTDADTAAIRQIWTNYVAFAEKGDAAAWLGQWDKDGIQMPPDAPARTKQQLDTVIPAAFKARTDANTMKMVLDAQEITIADGWAYSRGVYTQDLTNKTTGVVMHVDGKFLTIFKRQADGTWKIYRDCYNSNVAK
jgi:ketosteroid isomerase-like protein